MALNYIVTAQKPTVVTHAVVGSFVSPTDLSMVLAKTNRVELMLVTSEGLQPYRECPIFGRIATVKLFRAPTEVDGAFSQLISGSSVWYYGLKC